MPPSLPLLNTHIKVAVALMLMEGHENEELKKKNRLDVCVCKRARLQTEKGEREDCELDKKERSGCCDARDTQVVLSGD